MYAAVPRITPIAGLARGGLYAELHLIQTTGGGIDATTGTRA
jgi:hypothetical protein